MITWAESKYGYVGTLVRTKQHYVPPIIPPPTAEELSPENDPFGFVKDAYRDAVKERNKQIAEIHSKWINFSADLWSFLSENSQAAMKVHAEKYAQ
jgi:hypothetical protein